MEKRVPLLARPTGSAGARLSALFRTLMRRSGGRRQMQLADAQACGREPGCGARAAAAEGDNVRRSPGREPQTRALLGARCLGSERADEVVSGIGLGSAPRARRLLPRPLSWNRGSREPQAHVGAGAVRVAAVPDTPAPGNTPDAGSCAPGHAHARSALAAVEMLLAEAQQSLGAHAPLKQLLHAVAFVCSAALAGAPLPCQCVSDALGHPVRSSGRPWSAWVTHSWRAAADSRAGASQQALAALRSVGALASCAGAAALRAPDASLALLQALRRLCAIAQEDPDGA